MPFIKMRLIFILLILTSNSPVNVLAEEFSTAKVKSTGATLYLEQNVGSTTLGQYPAGSSIRVQLPAQNGFVSVHFSKPYKGVTVAWIPAESLEISNPVASPSRRLSSSDSNGMAKESGTAIVKSSGAILYSEQNSGSTQLGKYSPGYSIRVQLPEQDGFVSVHFAQPFKGVTTAWIPAESLEISNPVALPSRKVITSDSDSGASSDSGYEDTEPLHSRITLQADGMQVNPSGLQTALGGTNAALLGFGYDLEYEASIGRTLGWAFGLGSYSFAGSIAGSSNSSFSINGYSATLSLILRLFHGRSFSLELKGEQGVSLNGGGNTVSAQQISTSNLLGFPTQFELKAITRILGHFDLALGAGYKINTLNNFPLLTVSQSGNFNATNTNVNLNALFVNLGLAYQF